MRKKLINKQDEQLTAAEKNGLDLESIARVELSSESEDHPIEAAFTADTETGWRAAQPGKQTIRLVFDEPQSIRRIKLLFREQEQERAQEFLLRWQPAGDSSYREIVRQQYNFSPPQTTEEAEEYAVELNEVSTLELTINPDTNGNEAYALLTQLQLS
ncbi:hypothetical protein GCM10027443_07150 [Pontibacter brevis]